MQNDRDCDRLTLKKRITAIMTLFATIPNDLVDDEMLSHLGLYVLDLEDISDCVIPHGYPRWQVYRRDRLMGVIYSVIKNDTSVYKLTNTVRDYQQLNNDTIAYRLTNRVRDYERLIDAALILGGYTPDEIANARYKAFQTIQQRELIPNYF